MRKALRFIIPILVVIASLVVLSFVTSADNTDGAGEVWTPTDDTSTTQVDESLIAYAVWENEASYLRGDDPVAQYSDATLTTATIGKTAAYSAGYVRLYSDVNITSGIQTKLAQSIVIDLAGYTLNLKSGQLKLGEDNYNTCDYGTAEIKNGNVVHTGGCFYPYPGMEIRYTNLNVVSKSGLFIEDCGTLLSVFTDCTLTFEAQNSNILVSAKYNKPSSYKFVNTDIIQTVDTENALFVLSESAHNLDLRLTLIFDKDTTITRPTPNLVMLKERYANNTYCSFMYTQYVLFEEGCTFSQSAAPDLTYILLDVDNAGTLIGERKASSGEKVDNVVACVIAVVKVGETTPVDYFDFLDNGDGTVTASEIVYNHVDGEPVIENNVPPTCTESGSYDSVIYCTECGMETSRDTVTVPATGHSFEDKSCTVCGADKQPWEPSDSSVTFALFASEKDYLECMAPLAFFTDAAFTTDNIGSGSSIRAGYIVLYSNVTAGNMNTLAGQKIIFDLNGHTFTVTGEFKLGNNYSTDAPKTPITIRDGYIIIASSRIYPNTGTSLLIENVEMTVRSPYIIDDSGSMTKNGEYGHSIHLKDSVVYIENPDAKLSLAGYGSGKNTVLFENTDFIYRVEPNVPLLEVKYNKWFNGYSFDIRFDKDSSIQGGRGALIHMLATMPITDNVYIEEGFTANAEYFLGGFYHTVGEVGLGADPVCVISVVAPGEVTPIDKKLYAIDADCDGLFSISSAKVTDGSVAWYIDNPDSDYVIGGGKRYVAEDSVPYVTASDLGLASSGATLTLLSDLRIISDTDITLPSDFTLDLGGFTLHSSSSLIPDSSSGTLTLIGGKMSYTGTDAFITGVLSGGGRVIINGVNADLGNSLLISLDGGSVYIDNSVLRSTSALIVGTEGSVIPDIAIIASEIYSSSLLIGSSSLNASVSISDSMIESDYVIALDSSSHLLNVYISGCHINAFISTPEVSSDMLCTTISESYLKEDPRISSSMTVIAAGENVVSYSDSKYPIRVTSLGFSIRAGLVLNSDFTLHFYLPTDSDITGFHAGGEYFDVATLSKVDIFGQGEYYVLSVNSLRPDFAEEKIEYSIEFTKDGVAHRVDSYYSVVEYLETVLESDYSKVIKRLAASTLAYISSAYKYVGTECRSVDALLASEKVAEFIVENELPSETLTDNSALGEAIESVQLDLGATMRYRINLRPSYSGTLIVMDSSYEIIDGKVGELTYFELELRAYDMFDTVLTFTLDSGATGMYDLSAYVISVSGNDSHSSEAKALVMAFYTYCKCADAYVDLYE